MTAEEYYGSTSDSLSHFYEKLLKLKDMMNTVEGDRIADRRHAYMVAYIDEFKAEWKGER
jgi:hypothetical protein